jgi:small subunit ribosomal protein S11
VTLTDLKGDTKFWQSGGTAGFKGSQRATSLATGAAAGRAALSALAAGYTTIHARLRGPGNGGFQAVRSIAAAGLKIATITDITREPFNGCKNKKQRRL